MSVFLHHLIDLRVKPIPGTKSVGDHQQIQGLLLALGELVILVASGTKTTSSVCIDEHIAETPDSFNVVMGHKKSVTCMVEERHITRHHLIEYGVLFLGVYHGQQV